MIKNSYIMPKSLKYEYYLYTWGGFYNNQYKVKHSEEEGAKWFDSIEERSCYIDKLRDIENKLNAKHLMIVTCEGYTTRIPVICHRVIEYQGKKYYSTDQLWPDYKYNVASYHMNWKWYPGFNDYPVGDINYDDVKIIQEWITGAFEVEER